MNNFRRWINLCERADPQSAKFQRWFAGSKVVDAQGRPLMCYHGSMKNFEGGAFRPFTHFGTIDAAHHFVISSDEHDRFFTGTIQPVYLRIVKPFYYKDGASGNGDGTYIDNGPGGGVADIAMKMLQVRLIGREMFRKLNFRGTYADILKILSVYKYDGLAYENHLEDEGGISWVIFRSDQVWPVMLNEPDR